MIEVAHNVSGMQRLELAGELCHATGANTSLVVDLHSRLCVVRPDQHVLTLDQRLKPPQGQKHRQQFQAVYMSMQPGPIQTREAVLRLSWKHLL